MMNVHTHSRLELVCIDYLTLETSKGGIGNVLVITDHYTKYTMAIPTRNQTAKPTAEVLYTNFIVNFGIPTAYILTKGPHSSLNNQGAVCLDRDEKKSDLYLPP